MKYLHCILKIYSGYIRESQPVGTEIKGLEELSQSFTDFPYWCFAQLHSGDIDSFKLNVDVQGFHSISNFVFKYEVSSQFQVTIRSYCGKDIEAYSRIDIAVHATNDKVPSFERAVYNLDLDRATYVRGLVVSQVICFAED